MKIILSLAVLLFSTVANAEVMDKEFSMSAVLIFMILCSLISFIVARYKPILLFIIVPVAGIPYLYQIQEISDPYVGRAILIEAGELYFILSWFAPGLSVVSLVAGLICRYFAFRKQGG